jgi:DNA-binding NarL/FixJ family response regulator
MNGVARARVGILETSLKNLKAKEVLRARKIRVYVHADTVFLQERLARALGNEKDFEVVMDAAFASEDGKNANAPANTEKEILVVFSSGLVLEDLRRIHGWKIAMPELKVLLLGASQKEADFLQYARGGINGFLPGDVEAKELVCAVLGLSMGEAVCSGKQCAILFRHFEKEAETFPSAALHRDLGLTRREQQLIPLLTRGLTNKEIANHFSLSEQTVKNHLYRMKRKIGAHGRLEIADVCRQHGFPA